MQHTSKVSNTFRTQTIQMSSLFRLISRCIYCVCLSTMSGIASSSSYKSLHAVRIEEYDGKKISQSEIHTFTDVTKINCCAACSREKYCLSFHFHPDGPTCITLRERFRHVSVTSDAVPGYQLFQTDKPLATVGSDCELDVDCKSLSNSHCHNGSCTCDVGHRPDGNTCRNYTVACVSTPGYTWDADTDMCYRIETRQKGNWADAESICATEQGHLIKPDTQAKNDKLMALIQPTNLVAFWFGMRYTPEAAAWQWFDKTPVTSTIWGTDEPNGDGDCVHFLKDLSYKWNDAPCSSLEYYICEIPLN